MRKLMRHCDVEVRKSSLEGRGVFAARDFEPGEVVLRWEAEVICGVDSQEGGGK